MCEELYRKQGEWEEVYRMVEAGTERKSLWGRWSGGGGVVMVVVVVIVVVIVVVVLMVVVVVPQGRYQSGEARVRLGGHSCSVALQRTPSIQSSERERGRKTAGRIYREYRVYRISNIQCRGVGGPL